MDSFLPIWLPVGPRYVVNAHWSLAATSNAQRVRVESFFEDEGKVLSLQCLDFLAFFLVFLKSGCEVQVVCEFFGCVVGHAQERFIE